ncbi:thioredoxin family protein [Flavobacterium humi]|uniref:Thioredoxin n=1 Tax=Flavobacterium humi TaxID=2562683 RepID=A0A4Z0L675_9FLAO|nr:thioredoxin family protein [Flavobacterium humi]TGD57736.1 thioredoxin [Flavobacterium humi]
MKKTITFFALVFIIINAEAQQNMATHTTDPKTNTPMLVGKSVKEEIKQSPFSDWYAPNHDSYAPNSKTVEDLKKHTEGITITIFMGTWCEDSQHQVPAFYKILEQLNFDEKNVTLIITDRTKTTPDHLEKDKNITNVPTFIFYKNGKEIQRIVESPVTSLENDMLKIMSGQPYKHTYED